VPQPLGQPQRVRHLVDPRPVALAPRQGERQRDVLGGGQRRYQVERLEDEAEALAAQDRELGVVQGAQTGIRR
jgi:hypothetical protein